MSPTNVESGLGAVVADLAYHQMRVLILVAAVAASTGHQRKLDGMTKLAKLDFLVRYPGLAATVLDQLDATDPRLHLSAVDRANPTEAVDPMVRYKYGPWDDRYYPVVGAIVGRGLVKYVKGARGSVALAPTPLGLKLVAEIADTPEWRPVVDRCRAVAAASEGRSGTALKELVYERLAVLMDRPHRTVIS